MPRARTVVRTLLAILTVLLAATILRLAWVSDDAFITFRTIDNALNGYGLRWNPAERVQSYTHPLWLLGLLPLVGLTGNPYVSSIGLSLALTAGTVAILLWPVRHRGWTAATTLLALTLSKAFTDYSTSGLENPLSHALLAALAALSAGTTPTPRGAWAAGVLVALCGLTRFDLLLLAGPIGLLGLRHPRATLLPFALGFLPLLAWEVFSVVYYGVPFPNTAYAKLATGIPQDELTAQGWRYVRDSFERDPLTLSTIAAAVVAPLVTASWRLVPASLSLAANLAYVVHIGGDFMSGRFFSAAFVVAVAVLQRVGHPASRSTWGKALALPYTRSTWGKALALPYTRSTWRKALALPDAARRVIRALARPVPLLAVLAIGLAALEPPPVLLLRDTQLEGRQIWRVYGVVDERTFYFPRTGFIWSQGVRTHVWNLPMQGQVDHILNQHPTTAVFDTVGMAGYYVARDRHIIDSFALCDPLLARLPALRPWRIGHFRRELPQGYFESVANDRNDIADPGIAAVYDLVRAASRDPIWSRERWRKIWRLNLISSTSR